MVAIIRKKFITIIIISLFVVSCSCASAFKGINSEKVDEISGKLILVSKIADGELRYSDNTYSSDELKDVVSRKNKLLYNYFNDFYLGFNIEGKLSSVIVCDKERKYMIAEDSNCTSKLDKKDSTQSLPCSFTLNLNEICAYK
ncbi:MAG: hypothetical protein AB7U85_00560 [Alphaproteobacteria bacterium]